MMRTDPNGAVWRPYARGVESFDDLATTVHVWRVDLGGAAPIADVLSPIERARAARCRRPEDRARFAAARAILRSILADVLADVLGEAPDGAAALRLAEAPGGKPLLPDHPDLHFNLSHTRGLALVAVTRAGGVGIDVERPRPIGEIDTVAQALFDAAERAALRSAPPSARAEVFYRLWTRREALLKAEGIGVAGGDRRAVASLAAPAGPWCHSPVPGLVDAVATIAHPAAVSLMRFWSWPTTEAET